MSETIALSAELGAELVGVTDVDGLLDDTVIAVRREALKWRGVPNHESSLVWQRRGGRCSLVIGATADHIVGMPADQSRDLLDELLAWATQSRFCHAHEWSLGDAVLSDNTAVLHRALPYDLSSNRMLRRTHIKGEEAWA